MEKFIGNVLFYLSLVLLLSCDTNEITEQEDIIGKWQLIEVYSDPGDGSGEFNPVDSDKTIAFNKNGQFVSNGIMCHMSIEPTETSTGTYSLVKYTLTPDNCEYSVELPYEVIGNELIISHFCIEGCGEKYKKVE